MKQTKNVTPARSTPSASVQLRDGTRHPFGMLEHYTPLRRGEMKLYRSIREGIPVVDAAIGKIIRLVGGVTVRYQDERVQQELNEFLRRVNTGHGQRGLQSFLDCYLDSLLTCGQGVGEMVLSRNGRDICALLAGDPSQVEIHEGDSPLEFTLWSYDRNGQMVELPRQDLLLFTPFNPEAENPYGVSLLRSMPFLSDILMKIYSAIGVNWERMGNLRFAVVCRPGSDEGGDFAQERTEVIAREWSRAMAESKQGRVRDFVAVGDVDIKVIGADNQVLDSEVPVRQVLEQLVARTGIPPFMLGLSWSSTERMSVQQADILTSELTAIRRCLEPCIERICETWLRLRGCGGSVTVEWEEINLLDQVEEAKAELYRQQARKLALENDQLEAQASPRPNKNTQKEECDV